MSRLEQRALVAYVNSFKLPRRVTSFDQLSDGQVLMEVMSNIDPTHFKSSTGRSSHSAYGSSSDNWVLKMNTLKRLYRLLLSYPLPPPHPPTLAVTALPDPSFSTIAKSPTTGDGLRGLAQICRMCLAVGVWANGNEKIIARIQQLDEAIMAELMRSIEGIMATLPASEEQESRTTSPEKEARDPTPPPLDLIAERDRLLQENDELRLRCEQMTLQISEMAAQPDEVRNNQHDAVIGSAYGLDVPPEPSTLRSRQTPSSDVEALRSDLARAEEDLAHTEADLQKQTSLVNDLTKMVEDLKAKAVETAKLKDQLDEYRYTAERLQKSENVIEKYKKKLEDSAGLRRELKSLEQENAALMATNTSLEADLRKLSASKTLADSYKAQIARLEAQSDQQATEIAELAAQLEVARVQLTDAERAHEEDLKEAQISQDRSKELDPTVGEEPLLKRVDSSGVTLEGDTTLEDELDVNALGDLDMGDTKSQLRARIRALQRELASARLASDESHRITALETLLQEATNARDRYQSDYLDAHRTSLTLQARLERVASAKDGDASAIALQQQMEDIIEQRDALLKGHDEKTNEVEQLQEELKSAQLDLSLVDKDQLAMLAALKENAYNQTTQLDTRVAELKEQVTFWKEKDRLNLEEIKRLLIEKVDLQSAGISEREANLPAKESDGSRPDVQAQLLELHERNLQLSEEQRDLSEQLQRAKALIRDQNALLRAPPSSPIAGGDFEEAQRSYEAQIDALKADLHKARESTSALEKRYALEQQLMLSAWHELGSRTAREHLSAAGLAVRSRGAAKPVPNGWLGRQRRYMEEASFSR